MDTQENPDKQLFVETVVRQSGFDPEKYTLDDRGNITEKSAIVARKEAPSSALEAGAKAARDRAGAAIGGILAASAAAPFTGGMSLIPALAITTGAGLAGSYAGGKGQEYLAGKEEGKEFQGNAWMTGDEEARRLREEHPVATFVGGNVPMLLGGRPRIEQLKNLSTAGKAIVAGAPLVEAEKHALGNLAANVGIQGYGTAERALAGEKINPVEEAANLAFASSLGSWRGKPSTAKREFVKPAESTAESVTIGGAKEGAAEGPVDVEVAAMKKPSERTPAEQAALDEKMQADIAARRTVDEATRRQQESYRKERKSAMEQALKEGDKAEGERVAGINKVADELNKMQDRLEADRAKRQSAVEGVADKLNKYQEQLEAGRAKSAERAQKQTDALQEALRKMDERSRAEMPVEPAQPVEEPLTGVAAEIARRKAERLKFAEQEQQLQADPKALRRALKAAEKTMTAQERAATEAEIARVEAELEATKAAAQPFPVAKEPVFEPTGPVTRETYVGEEVPRKRIIPEIPSVPRGELGLNEPPRSPIEAKAAMETGRNPEYRYSGAEPVPGETVGRKAKEGTREALLEHFIKQGGRAQEFEGPLYTTEGDVTSRRGKWGRGSGIEVNKTFASDTGHEIVHDVIDKNIDVGKRLIDNPEIQRLAEKAGLPVDEYIAEAGADRLIKRYESGDSLGLKDAWNTLKYHLGSTDPEVLNRVMENRFLYGAQTGGGELTAGVSGGKGILDTLGGGKYSGEETQTPEFKRWFAGSTIVDENGAPIKAYHGSMSKFNVFDTEKSSRRGWDSFGNWFAPDKYFAESYQGTGKYAPKGDLHEVYLRMRNPKVYEGTDTPQGAENFKALMADFEAVTGVKTQNATAKDADKFKNWLSGQGYDGVVIKNTHADWQLRDPKIPSTMDMYITLESRQSKKASPVTYDDAGKTIPQENRYGVFSDDIRYSGATGSVIAGIKEQSPQAMDAAEKMFNERTRLRGELGGDVINKLQKFDINTVAAVMAKHQDAYRNGTQHTMTGEEAKISKILQDHWDNVRNLQRQSGYARQISGSNLYVPEMVSNDVRAMTEKGIHNPQVREIIDAIKDHWIKGGMDPVEAAENAENYVIGISGARFGRVGMGTTEGFDPLRVAAGLGLPEKTASGIPIRETDPLRILQRYGDQAATDMAFQREVATKLDPKLLESLRTQKEGPWQIMENLYWNQDKVNLPTLRAANKLVTSSVLGPISKAVEVATNPQNAMLFGAGFGDVTRAVGKVAGDWSRQYDKAVKAGIITPRSAGEENFGQIYGGGTPVHIMNKVSDFIGTYTGTKFLEETSRVLSYSLGEATAQTRKAAGDAKWFKERGVDINDPQAVEKAAGQMAEMIQGRRDARELPAVMLKGPLAEIAPIHRWAVGHSANLVKEIQQGNYSNLVGYLAAGLGVAIGRDELNKFIKGHEGATPTMKELEVAGYPKAKTAAAITDMLRSAGIGGALVDITNYSLKKAGNQNAQLIYNPLASAVQTSVIDMVPQFAEAVNQGVPPLEVAEILGKNILRSLSQVGSVAMDLSKSKEETEQDRRARNFRTFQSLVEDKPAFSGTANPALMEENRKFGRTTDPAEMERMLDILERRGKPMATPRNYMAPADPLERMRYMRYLEATGENEPGLIEDIYAQDAANRMKGAMIRGRGLGRKVMRLKEIMGEME